MKHYFFLLFLIASSIVFSQKKHPRNYFGKPLDIPIILAGTFGELRTNHFHSGLDIKTQQREGLKVYATAEGYVSRIKISLWGYGKVLYITHPNGYTTVYAHLKKFSKPLEDYIKTIQYQKERFEVQVFPKPGELTIHKGEVIAYSGSTGGFVAPHLHYEIRDTKTEKIINPMLFGLVPSDTKPPVISGLKVYALNDSSHVNQSNIPLKINFKQLKNGNYLADKIEANGTIGFSVKTFDRLNGAINKNGVYCIEMLVNGKKLYRHTLETFSFAESKYINLLIDYPYFAKKRSRFQKTFIEPVNKLSIYNKEVGNGHIFVSDSLNYNVQIVVSDFKKNKTILTIPIVGKNGKALIKKEILKTPYHIIASNFHKFHSNGVTIAFPKNTFYKDFYLDFKVKDSIAIVHKPTLPLHKSYTLTFDVSNYTEEEKKQLFIAQVNEPNAPKYSDTKKKKDSFYTTTKVLGNYKLIFDKVKPSIKPYNFKNKQWLTKYRYLKVKIEDSLSGINSYRAEIDGKWVLMEYNVKKNILTYDFNDLKLKGAKHQFKLTVKDNVGNTNTYTATFYRKK